VHARQLEIPAESRWARLPLAGTVIGALGIAASALLGRNDPAQFYFSWLVAFLFFLSIALGGLFFVLVHHATKSQWGVVVRRLGENAMATLPLFVLLFIPVALGLHHLYSWSNPEVVSADPLLSGKQAFLNPTFFWIRTGIYFAVWSILALAYRRASRRQDATGEERLSRRMIFWSGPSIILFALTVTFASFDWIMSLDPHWYSTIFGVYFFSGSLVAIFAFLILTAASLERAGYLQSVVTDEHFHDLGKLLFAFMVFWTYIAFAQFFLIWYGNIPEETVWYLHRQEGSWMAISALLGWGHFALPFLFLMPRTIKRRRPLLVGGAVWMLLMHLVDLHWLVMPVHQHHGFHPTLLDLTTLVGVGGLFVALFTRLLRSGALVPLGDPRLPESLSFENF
jgi:hypothetical protein